jgi:phosphate transport system substrate-binding protein
MRKTTWHGWAFVALTLAAFPALAETLRISGTGAALGSVEAVAKAYEKAYPSNQVRVLRPSPGSSGGIKALQAGALDLAVSSRPLKEAERAQGLTAIEFARTPFVVAVAAGLQRPAGLSLEQLADIYSGRTSVWPNGRPIRLILRPLSDSDTVELRRMSPEMDRAVAVAQERQGMMAAYTDQDSADAIEKTPGAIGTSTLALIVGEKRPLRPLALAGVEPTPGNLADGRYPYSRSFYLVMRKDAGAEARRFAAFLRSAEGRAVLGNNGCLTAEGD